MLHEQPCTGVTGIKEPIVYSLLTSSFQQTYVRYEYNSEAVFAIIQPVITFNILYEAIR